MAGVGFIGGGDLVVVETDDVLVLGDSVAAPGTAPPVPLGLLTGRVVDHRDRAALGRPARLAGRAQATHPQLTGHGRVGPGEPQVGHLVHQRGRPQVRVLGQPGGAVGHERLEQVRARAGSLPSDTVAVGVGADGLAVTAEVVGDLVIFQPRLRMRERRCRPPV